MWQGCSESCMEGRDSMAVSDAVYSEEREIVRLVDDSRIDMLSGLRKKLKDMKEQAVRSSIAVMLNELYSHDLDDLKRDISKVILMKEEHVEIKPSERIALLRVLWWVVMTYFDGDSNLAVKMCREICHSQG